MLKLLDIYREHPKAKKVVIKASYMQTCRRIVAFQYGNRAFNQLGKIFEAVRSHYPGEQKRFLEFINQIL